jgi:hypothetical protein
MMEERAVQAGDVDARVEVMARNLSYAFDFSRSRRCSPRPAELTMHSNGQSAA